MIMRSPLWLIKFVILLLQTETKIVESDEMVRVIVNKLYDG